MYRTQLSCAEQEAKLCRVREEVKRNRELLDSSDDIPEEDELYRKLATAANALTAKDSLIQVTISAYLLSSTYSKCISISIKHCS